MLRNIRMAKAATTAFVVVSDNSRELSVFVVVSDNSRELSVNDSYRPLAMP